MTSFFDLACGHGLVGVMLAYAYPHRGVMVGRHPDIARLVIRRILNPRLLSPVAAYDVASNVLCLPRYPTHFEPSFLEFSGILRGGEQCAVLATSSDAF